MAFAPGHRLGPYEIRRSIGSGGMGEVYSAFDARLHREVAVKVLFDSATSAASRVRLEREARAVAALSHPNVVSIFDIGSEGDSVYIVSELLEGATVREALRHERLPISTAVKYARQAAAALQAAHEKGIVHRDIKPENLFITNDGRLKVLDFGLARVADSTEAVTAVHEERLTAPNTIVGTVGYMSPEQLRGESIDQRSDIFSLGCVIFEMFGGGAPFQRQAQTATVAAILGEEPDYRSLSLVAPPLIAVLQRCLAKERRNRYQSADALIADLDRFEATARDGGMRAWAPRIATAAAAALAVILVAAAWFGAWRRETRSAPPLAAQRRAMLAVLPFENLSGDPSQEYFSDGLTEETITEFGRLSPARLGVIARSSTARYKNAHTDVRAIGRELGVDYIVEGSVRRDGERMRVSAHLVRARDGTQVWADAYDRTVNDVLAMQAELARGVAAAVEIKVAPGRPAQNTLPENGAARETYLRGRYYLNLGTAVSRRKAVESMQQAVALDPHSAVAYAGLAEALVNQSTLDYAPREVIPKAREIAEKALQLDDGIADAHQVLGSILLEYYWNWADAERELRRALAIDPNSANSHLEYATLLITSSRFKEGLQELKRGRELDPISAAENRDGLFNIFCTRRYEDALQQARRAIDIEPQNDLAYAITGIIELQRGKKTSAAAAADHVMAMTASQTARTIAAYVYASVGRESDARAIIRRIEEESRQQFVCFFNVATLYAVLGQPESAFAALERGYRDRTG